MCLKKILVLPSIFDTSLSSLTMKNLKSYPTRVLNERMWHFWGSKTYSDASCIFSGPSGQDVPTPTRISAPVCTCVHVHARVCACSCSACLPCHWSRLQDWRAWRVAASSLLDSASHMQVSLSPAVYLCPCSLSQPRAGSRVERVDPLHFLARCRTRRLNQALSLLSFSLGFFLSVSVVEPLFALCYLCVLSLGCSC